MAGAGFKDFVAGDVLTATQVDTYLMQQSIMSFAGTAARASAITAPAEGYMTYLQDTDQLSYYTGSAWVNAPGKNPTLYAPEEVVNVSASTATGTVTINANTDSVTYFTANAAANFVVNLRGNASVSMNNQLQTGEAITSVFLNTCGSPAYYPTAIQVDGGTAGVSTRWQGGAAPTAGNASSIDSYSFTVIKTAGSAFTVLASQTQFK
jgi:hypothetical protein